MRRATRDTGNLPLPVRQALLRARVGQLQYAGRKQTARIHRLIGRRWIDELK